MDIKQHASALGRKRIADRFGLTVNAVSEAVRSGAYPAAWYPALRELGAEVGVEVPARLFRWKGDADLTGIDA